MKRILQRLIRRMGYDLQRLPAAGTDVVYPYVEEFHLDEVEFRYWITDATYREWYNPTAHAGWHETQAYRRLVERGDRVLEVGCNNGFTMCLLKSLAGPDALYVGLDVIPFNCQIAMSQVVLNGFRNCNILNAAGSDARGTLSVANLHNGFVTTDRLRNAISVPAVPCDDFIESYGHFDLLKIDVEGYEGTVLRGCGTLLERRPKLILELHGADVHKFRSSYAEIFDLVHVQDYEGYTCLRGDNELREFEAAPLARDEPHATVFLHPKTAVTSPAAS